MDCASKVSVNSLKKRKNDLQWEKKWRNMIHQKAVKEEMNKQLKATLERQKQEEEEKECTFKPQTLWNQNFRKTISFVDEFFVKLQPYIEQQQAYLNQIKELEYEDQLFAQKVKEELRIMLSKAVDKEIMETIIEGYKGVRTRGMNKVKREKLDILSKMIKLEREYNCFMARENVDKKDLEECGFDCDLAVKLRNDILKESLCPNSLRDFAKIRQEINHVLEEELQLSESQNMFNESSTTETDSSIPNEKDIIMENRKRRTIEESLKLKGNLKNNTMDQKSTNRDFIKEKKDLMKNKVVLERNNPIHVNVDNTPVHKDMHIRFQNVTTTEEEPIQIPSPYISTPFKHPNYNTSMSPSKEYSLSVGNSNQFEMVLKENLQRKYQMNNPKESMERIESQHPSIQNKIEPVYQINGNNTTVTNKGIDIKTRKNTMKPNNAIYLNNDFMKVLKKEEASKYISTLHKENNSMNLYILGNSNQRTKMNEQTNEKNLSIKQSQNVYTPESLNEIGVLGKVPTTYLSNTIYNTPVSTLTNRNTMGPIDRNGMNENLYGINVSKGGIRSSYANNISYPKGTISSVSRSNEPNMDKQMFEVKNKNTRYVDNSDGYQIYNVGGIPENMKKPQMTTQGNNTMNHLNYAYINKIQSEPIKKKENKPLFNKLIDKLPIYNNIRK